MERPISPGRFRFDQYEVNLASAELKRNGRKIPIQDKPLRLLALLSQRQGEVVTRGEIQEHLWPPDTTVVYDDGLNTAVKKLREALNDNSDKPRYIETVRRRGYRFLGQVQEPVPEVAPVSVERFIAPVAETVFTAVETELPKPVARALPKIATAFYRRSWMAGGLAAVAIAGIAVSVWFGYRRRASAGVADRPHTIAVLPVANLTGDPQRGYLSDGETVDIITRLGDEDPAAIHVIARTSAMSFRNSTQTARQIGEALGADYLLEGSFQGDTTQIHLTAQLIRAVDQTQVWTRSYVGSPGQLQQFENDIADRAAESLPGSHNRRNPPQQTIVTAAAHDLYLKGLSGLNQRSSAGFEAAMLDFGDAIQKEPRYAEAYAELAVTYNLMGQYNWMRQGEARSQGRAAALQALALDPALAEAKAALGFSYWFYDWDNERARQELAAAVASEPNNVDARHWLAMVLITSNQLPQAEAQMQSAIALDPASPILKTNLGWVHYLEGRYPLAVGEMTAVTRQSPKFISAHYKLIPAAFMMGDQRLAWQETRSLMQFGSNKEMLAQVDREYEKSGYLAALKAIIAAHDDAYYTHEADRARDLLFAGDPSAALTTLEEGVRNHDSWMIFVPVDPAFTALRGNPRFLQVEQAIRQNSAEVAAAR